MKHENVKTNDTGRPVRTAVFVSGGGTNLQALIDAQKSGKIKSLELSLVVSSNPDAFALTRATTNNIPSLVFPRRNFSADEFESHILNALEKADIELIILAGFMCILSENFVKRYPKRIINVHPSLIPSFCGEGFYGLKVHEAALNYGVKVTGATVHYVNEIPDGGQIILQKAVAVRRGDTPKSLQHRVMVMAEWEILPRAAELVAQKLKKER